VPCAADQKIIAGTASQHVVAGAAEHDVIAGAAVHRVSDTVFTRNEVVLACAVARAAAIGLADLVVLQTQIVATDAAAIEVDEFDTGLRVGPAVMVADGDLVAVILNNQISVVGAAIRIMRTERVESTAIGLDDDAVGRSIARSFGN